MNYHNFGFLILQIIRTAPTGYKYVRILNGFILSMEPSFDIWLKAEMGVFCIASTHAVTELAACLDKAVFGHGIPDVLVTDSGTQFSSEEFFNFSKTWDLLM